MLGTLSCVNVSLHCRMHLSRLLAYPNYYARLHRIGTANKTYCTASDEYDLRAIKLGIGTTSEGFIPVS